VFIIIYIYIYILLVPKEAVEFDDEFILFFREIPTFEVRAEVVDPSETAALAAAEKAGGFGERAPAAFTVSSNVSYEAIVFFFGPCTFVRVCFLTTRGPSHPFFFFFFSSSSSSSTSR